MPTKTHWFKIIVFLVISNLAFAQKKEIKNVLFTQQNAWNKGDLEGYMQGYWKNDSLLFIGAKGPTYGWEKTLENYKKSYPTTEKMGKLDFSEVKIKMLGKNYAFVTGKWNLKREKDNPGGIFTLVFQQFKKEWRIISDHTQ
jgi:ketosteroid isomerase-like protein